MNRTLLILAASAIPGAVSGQTAYTVTDPGNPLNLSFTSVSGFNNAGQVIGYGFNSAGVYRSFLIQNGVTTDLGDLGGGSL